MILALRPAVLHFGRNSWPSAAAKMLPGPSYQPVDSQYPILNRPLCYELSNVRQGEGEGTQTLQRRPQQDLALAWETAPAAFGPGIVPGGGLGVGCLC